MAITDIFKKKPAKVEARPALKAAKVRPLAQALPAKSKGGGERRWIGILLAPHLTEKSNRTAAQGWYAFRVAPQANKLLVKLAVQERYGVEVERVRMLSQKPKKIRRGSISGTVPGFKKAMVKVKAGQSIEFT